MVVEPARAVRTGSIAVALFGLLTAAGLFSCSTPPDGSGLSRAARDRMRVVYPADAPVDDLDIVVTRDGPDVVLINRTPRVYRHAQLWINQQYVWPVDTIPIGERVELPLASLVNEHGEPFPVGGFLTPDKTLPLVLAELYFPPQVAPGAPKTPTKQAKGHPTDLHGQRFRLVVRSGEK